ncbi:MAG TPA: methyltransferase domain-containing protein, partial [Sporichthyaceae bacterium]
MDERKFDELIANGHLQPDWRPSFLAVPRRQFIPPTIWRKDKARPGPNLVPVNQHEHPDLWRDLVDGDDVVITQVDDGDPPELDAGEAISSSASTPEVAAMMLKHLDVHGGERVLEIGTGTGWNAALMAHRLGADRVTSIEVDPELATYARKALADAGYGAVRVVTGDGTWGHRPEAPYHRIIATVACAEIPYPWVTQTRTGGRIVAPSCALDYHGLLLALTVAQNGTAIGHAV